MRRQVAAVYAAAVAGIRRAKSTASEHSILRGEVSDVAGLEPLWISRVEHHRAVAGDEWPVRASADAWAIRREEYLGWRTAPARSSSRTWGGRPRSPGMHCCGVF